MTLAVQVNRRRRHRDRVHQLFDVFADQPGKARAVVALLRVVTVDIQRLLTALNLLEQHHADIKVMVLHPHTGEVCAGALAIA